MKYVIVTGAYGGMGKATVDALTEKGYCVFAFDKKVEQAQHMVIPVEVDVTDNESIKRAFDMVSKITDQIYSIVHLAGVYSLDSLVEVSEEKFMQSFEVNLFGTFRINKTFISLLKNGSKIVVMTSELAPLNPLPFTGIYAVSKSALDKYAFSLGMELQLLGISVSVLRAGAVKTGLLNVANKELDNFCKNTKLYPNNSSRFKKIVNSIEARNVPPQKIAKKICKILFCKRPKTVYKINRNPLLLILDALPYRFQKFIIKIILKNKKKSNCSVSNLKNT